MQINCQHFVTRSCISCNALPVPYHDQVAAKGRQVQEMLAPFAAEQVWEEPFYSPVSQFRNRAKMVVSGSANNPILGTGISPSRRGEAKTNAGSEPVLGPVDLCDCQLYPPVLRELFPAVKQLIRRAQLPPYDVERARGELKYVLLTVSPRGQILLRFVLRSDRALGRLLEHLPVLLGAHPNVVSVWANFQPLHAAVLEGPTDQLLAGDPFLVMPVGPVELALGPRAFFQTNSVVARGLYEVGARWVLDSKARSFWDLYCGVGGFALTTAALARDRGVMIEALGVEISAAAIEAAKTGAAWARLDSLRFCAGDAAHAAQLEGTMPDLVLVNPPRRGIGSLARWLADSSVKQVIYSSCNPHSLAADLAQLQGFEVSRAKIFDMFPHTDHVETMVSLERRRAV